MSAQNRGDRSHSSLNSSSSSKQPKGNSKKLAVSVLLGFLVFLGIGTLFTVFKVKNSAAPESPLPQDPDIQVYMNQNRAAEFTEPYRKIARKGDDFERLIVDTIEGANSSVDVAVQELRLPEIAAALVERKKAGVRVRVILENSYSRPWSEFKPAEVSQLPERERQRYNEFLKLADSNGDGQLSPQEIKQKDALVILRDAGVPVIDDRADGSKGSGLMHHKFVIVDGARLIVTSANFTTSDVYGDFSAPASRGNANNLLKINSSQVAAVFAQEFNLMWGDKHKGKRDSKFGVKKPFRPPQVFQVGKGTLAVQFSPSSKAVPWSQSSNGTIGKTLSESVRSVDLALFVFSEQQLGNILENAHERGVRVRALIEPDFAYRTYSEALDMMGVALGDICRYEAGNRPWAHPIATVGTPVLPQGDLLHHKFAIVDGETVIAGSHNWSEEANSGNDETLLVIHNPTVAAHFVREFERLYAGAKLGLPPLIQRRIQVQQEECGPANAGAGQPADSGLSAGEKVNLNTASLEELQALPGVGRKLAKQIVAARQQKPFTSLEDLDRVPGVGPKLLSKLKDRVTW
jgi:competence ComEA-like helix-hairpin-helix protein